MRIAIDTSPLARGGDGIARYLRFLLRALLEQHGPHEWVGLGRRRDSDPGLSRVTWKSDHLPPRVGAVLALGTTLPAMVAGQAPDLFWGPAHRLPALLPRRTAGVVTIHDLCWLKAPSTMRPATRWLDEKLMPRALARADRIITVSSATAADLEAAFPSCAGRIVRVHSAAASLPTAQPREALQAWGIHGPYVLCVGTLEPRKNLGRLVEAFGRVSSAQPGTQLVIAGAHGWGATPGRLIDAAAASRVLLLGHVGDEVLATLYRHAELLAMPSLYEGFGLPLLEALSQGTPVLFGNNSAMPEVAGDAGLGVTAESVDSIADGLSRMLRDDALRGSLASRAVAQAARFSWERAARETLAVFGEAVAERRSSR